MKCSGKIGYARTEETSPGVYQQIITEKQYYGDLVRSTAQIIDSSTINSSVKLNNNISVLCNNYMSDNLGCVRYLTFKKSKWKVSSMEIKDNRIIFTLGDLYNEQED